MTKLIQNLENLIVNPKPIQTPAQWSPQDFGKVAVLYGGRSAERAVSLQSGDNVLKALKKQGVDAHGIDVDDKLSEKLLKGNFARAFIVLHGKEGEDGVVQGLLHMMNIPYTGSKVAASALAMDKARSKLVMHSLQIPTPVFGVAKNEQQAHALAVKIGFPVSFKPVAEGSSIGVTRVNDEIQIQKAYQEAAVYGEVIVEKWIDGVDFFVSVLGDKVLPSVEVHPAAGFYDYQAKYESEKTQYFCPSLLTEAKETELRALAFRAFCALGCEGWGRVDLMQDKAGNFWVLEVNTIPGMTSHSLVPMSAKACGLSFEQLVYAILETSLEENTAVKLGKVANR